MITFKNRIFVTEESNLFYDRQKKLLTKNHAPISRPCEIASFFIPNTLIVTHVNIVV